MDERKGGINRTVMLNTTTGQREVVYEARGTSLQFWLSVVIQILTIGVIVFGAVKVALNHEIRGIIREELSRPNGAIYLMIDSVADEKIEKKRTEKQ